MFGDGPTAYEPDESDFGQMSDRDEQEEFSIGDIVLLKSGSPKMTVCGFETFNTTPIVSCTWFDLNLHACVAKFHKYTLRTWSPPCNGQKESNN